MQAIELLTQRVSASRLTEPAPSQEQREVLFQAAMRAPDHGLLRPWRFVTIEGEARNKLGKVFADEVQANDPAASAEKITKAQGLLLRAPLIIGVIYHPTLNHKVTEFDQLLAAGCAAHAIVQAAFAQGLGAIWRTGEMVNSQAVLDALAVNAQEKMVGFIYLGQNMASPRHVAASDLSSFVTAWE